MKKAWMLVRDRDVLVLTVLLLGLLSTTGCGPKLSSPEQLKEFHNIGALETDTDVNDLEKVQSQNGPYRVVAGDILDFQMPVILRVISSDLSEWMRPSYGHKDVESYLARVNETGTITLPIINELHVAGKTLAEVESTVIDAYYPQYVVNPPMIVCQVSQYRDENERVFTVMGLVHHPDAFPYPSDVKYNLMEALAFAGGLNMVADPRVVKIYRQDLDGKIVSATFGVDKKSLNDAYKVTIKPGDVIYVDHTLRTRTNQFLAEVFHISVGADARYSQ